MWHNSPVVAFPGRAGPLTPSGFYNLAPCVDGLPHHFLPVPSKQDWVYCAKCLVTTQLAYGGTPPDPVPPDPPANTVVIKPTGGDDAALIQGHLNNLPSGQVLMLSGMFNVGSTIWLDGHEKELAGDPARQSGIRVTAQGMSGHYGSMLCSTPNAARCRLSALEFDGQNKQTGIVFFDGGVDNEISDCFLHDVGSNPNGAPFGAIHSQNVAGLRVLRNLVERTGGIAGGEGVRGIYICGSSCWIEGNTVRDTGHTGIAAEGGSVAVIGNLVERIAVQGTGFKMVYRAQNRRRYSGHAAPTNLPPLYFADNVCHSTKDEGLMLQDCGNAAVLVERNQFIACGHQGSTFGAIYSSNQADNVTFRSNHVENCRSIAGLRNARNWTFTDTTIVNGSDVVYLEDNCHQITLTRSGRAHIGSNVGDVWVDGVKVA